MHMPHRYMALVCALPSPLAFGSMHMRAYCRALLDPDEMSHECCRYRRSGKGASHPYFQLIAARCVRLNHHRHRPTGCADGSQELACDVS